MCRYVERYSDGGRVYSRSSASNITRWPTPRPTIPRTNYALANSIHNPLSAGVRSPWPVYLYPKPVTG